ncbi:phosphocholine cytidylyltransferase family protein, partial [Chloroflexota bacterium]
MVKKSDTISERHSQRRSYSPVRKAIILAAGNGRRMGLFTVHTPKCLVPVNGIPILINMLTHLSRAGVEETVIVVGHLKENIYDMVGTSFNGMKVSYIESDRHATTNNIYSLWLAREHLTEDVLLLEADVFFDRSLLDRIFSNGHNSVAAVAWHQSWMSGTVVSLDKEGNVQALLETRHQGPQFDYSGVYKTVNVYLLRRDFLHDQVVSCLESYINAGDVNQYYEVIFHTTINSKRHKMTAVLCDDIKWFEIDD